MGKNRKVVGLMKYQKGVAYHKSYSYCVQKYDHEIEDSKSIRQKGFKKLVGKKLKDFVCKKYLSDSMSASLAKQQVSFRDIKHVDFTIKFNAMYLRKLNDKQILDEI